MLADGMERQGVGRSGRLGFGTNLECENNPSSQCAPSPPGSVVWSSPLTQLWPLAIPVVLFVYNSTASAIFFALSPWPVPPLREVVVRRRAHSHARYCQGKSTAQFRDRHVLFIVPDQNTVDVNTCHMCASWSSNQLSNWSAKCNGIVAYSALLSRLGAVYNMCRPHRHLIVFGP